MRLRRGLTGRVEFDDQTGERLVHDGMDILNVLSKDVVQVETTSSDQTHFTCRTSWDMSRVQSFKFVLQRFKSISTQGKCPCNMSVGKPAFRFLVLVQRCFLQYCCLLCCTK